jgi:flagellar FliJ protein
MAKYRFRLETLQRVREARRNEQRASLAEAYQAERVLTERQADLAAEVTATRKLRQTATTGRYTDVNRLVEAQRYELLLRAQEQELNKQKILLAAEIERRRQMLVEADREVRALELLDERHQQAFNLEQQRRETKTLDEIATNRWQLKQVGK